MATLVPEINSCVSRMTSGEKRFALRLKDKLEDDYLCWYDVSIGEHMRHPDFVIFHAERGLLVLEVKDWKLDTLHSIDKRNTTILTDHGIKHVLNPVEQARQYMYAIINRLERDPQLIAPSGLRKGKLLIPFGHGVVFSNINRKQFQEAGIGDVIPPHLVICQDEMTESADAEAFHERLWQMFPYKLKRALPLPTDRIRWHMYPEIRISAQSSLFDEPDERDQQSIELPDVLRVMDIQQEQLARSLGEGHRVIHGVAGSGKTLILGYRAEHLAKLCTRPILILCYNKTLAAKLASVMEAKGLQDRVHVANFHSWCVRQLNAYNIEKPPQAKRGEEDTFFEDCVERVIRGVDNKHIPSAQYDAVLIDEGHDFKPEWFKLVVQMIHPDTNSLLVLYDDAQSIYNGPKKLRFSFSSVGVQAKGRTTILKLNYRNTAEILAVARAFADDLLSPSDTEEDQAPTVLPMSAGRRGPKPLLIKLPSLKEEAAHLANRLKEANRTGMPWNDMAVLYRHYAIGKEVADTLKRMGVPVQWQQDKKQKFEPLHDSVKLITLHSSKGLEFPLVCMPAIGASDDKEHALEDEARLLYVAMTRAMQELVMTHHEESVLGEKVRKAMGVLENV